MAWISGAEGSGEDCGKIVSKKAKQNLYSGPGCHLADRQESRSSGWRVRPFEFGLQLSSLTFLCCPFRILMPQSNRDVLQVCPRCPVSVPTLPWEWPLPLKFISTCSNPAHSLGLFLVKLGRRGGLDQCKFLFYSSAALWHFHPLWLVCTRV